jgi:hypothetical protein
MTMDLRCVPLIPLTQTEMNMMQGATTNLKTMAMTTCAVNEGGSLSSQLHSFSLFFLKKREYLKRHSGYK